MDVFSTVRWKMQAWARETRTETRADLSRRRRKLPEPIQEGYIFISVIDEKHLHMEPVVASHSHYCLPAREKVLKLTSVLDISVAWRSREAPGSLPLTKDYSSKQSTAGALKFL